MYVPLNRYSLIRQPLGILQNWRLTETGIDRFCHVWYDEIVDKHGSCGTPFIWCSGTN